MLSIQAARLTRSLICRLGSDCRAITAPPAQLALSGGAFCRRIVRWFNALLTRVGLVFPRHLLTTLAKAWPIGSGDMADETATEDTDDQSEELDALEGADELAGGAKKSGRKKLLMIVLPIILLGGGGAGVWFSGLADSFLGNTRDRSF